MNINQISVLIASILKHANLYSDNAHALLLATGAQESNYEYITQLDNGPAKGFWQVEPTTAYDHFTNYLKFRIGLKERILNTSFLDHKNIEEIMTFIVPSARDKLGLIMSFNISFALLMARISYYRIPSPIPNDIDGLAIYWKDHYNTQYGSGTTQQFKSTFKQFELDKYCNIIMN